MNLSKDKTIDLVSRCGDGEEEALRQFFEIYSEDIYNFPMKIFHLSEDDAGDFFIYAFERLKTGSRFGSFKGKSSFRQNGAPSGLEKRGLDASIYHKTRKPTEGTQ